MVIRHNTTASNANRQLNINNTSMSQSTEKLSSGYRINRAGDDAAGLAISEKMRAQIRGLDQGSTNAQDGESMVQTIEGALNETQSMAQRLKTLATQAANGTLTTSDRGQITLEVNELKSEINRIASQTTFNGMKVLATSGGSVSFQVGANSGESISFTLKCASVGAIGLSSVDLSTQSAASASIDLINKAVDNISSIRATLGAVQNRLEHTVAATDNTSENLQAAESRIRDTDMSKEYMSYSNLSVLVKAGTSMLSQANSQSQNVLSLLQG